MQIQILQIGWTSGDTIRRRSTTSALIQLLTDLSKVFITAAYDALNKAYDLFSMMDGVDKHLAVIEDERRLMGRVLEGGFIDIPYLTGLNLARCLM